MQAAGLVSPGRGSRPVPCRGRRLGAATVALGAALCLSGCAPDEVPPGVAFPDYVETGDLEELKQRGYLRILLPPTEPTTLPRRGYSLNLELRLARELCRELGLTAKVKTYRNRDKMLDALEAGKGDLVVAGLTATDARRERFDFSTPTGHAREMLVVRADDGSILEPEDLGGKTVAVRRSSSYRETLETLRETLPDLRIESVPEHLDTAEILDLVATGTYRASVADDLLLESVLDYRQDLRAAFPLTEERPVAWAMRKGSQDLKVAVDRFLQRRALDLHMEETYFGDLDTIQERQVLRVLTRNSAATYFLHRGSQVGFEFELARRFARSLGCRIQVVVPPEFEDLIPWLLRGRGDIVAAAMTDTADRRRRVAFGRPYNFVREMLVAHTDDVGLKELADLEGREVTVLRASSYYETLLELQQHVAFSIAEAEEDLETEDLIAMVGEGRIGLTVADSNILDIELSFRDDVRPAFALGDPQPIAWAVRPEDQDLLAAVSDFVAGEYRGEFYNVLQDKYYRNRARIARVVTQRPSSQGRISPYDDLFRLYGERFGIDWRLLAAQAYQESEFETAARSWAGALGLMQLMPRTAKEMGVVGDLHDPETAIRAGSRYMRRLMDRFDETMPFQERVRFALASYNVGHGHVQDGRRLARELGYDPDVWFGHVEAVMPLLSTQQHARDARYGYCRCREPVKYVREVNERFVAYAMAVP